MNMEDYRFFGLRTETSDAARIRKRIDQISNGLAIRRLRDITAAYALNDSRFSAFEDRAPFRRLGGKSLKHLFKEVEEMDQVTDKKNGVKVNIFGDVGLATGYEDWSTVKGGVRTRAKSRFTMLFIRKGGDWFVIHEHFTRTT